MTSPSSDRRQGLNSSAALKVPCRAATTANIVLAGLQTIDGVVLASGDRVLVKNQAVTTQNGIYVADTGAWTRDLDFDGAYDAVTGTVVFVTTGTANQQTSWMVNTIGSITIGTSAITFSPITYPNLAGTSSGLLTFLQAGVNAVIRWLQDKVRETISVTDFASVADALTAASGKRLYFPAGTYTLTADTPMPSNTLIEGDGAGTVITASVAGAGIGQLYANGKSNITIRNVQFASQTAAVSFVPTFTLCTNVRVEGCIFQGLNNAALSSVGLRSQGSIGLTVRDCQFYDFSDHVYLDASAGTDSDDIKVLGCYFEQTIAGTANNPTGVYQYNCKKLLVEGCTFKNIQANGGAPIAGYSVYEGDGAADSLVVANCLTIMTAAEVHIMVQNSNATHCLVQGNRFYGQALGAAGSNYLYNGGATRGAVEVLDNYSQQGAILVTGSGTAATGVRTAHVRGNQIIKCEQNTAAIRIGVTGANYVDFASVRDNVCYCTYGGSINISEANYAIVEGNRCMNWNTQNNGVPTAYAYTAAIYWLGTVKAGKILNNRIENNAYVPADTGYPQYAIVADAAAPSIVSAGNNIASAMTAGNYVNITPTSGTYTPVATLTANLDAAVPSVAQFLRVDDSVTVSGHTTIDPTAAGPTATQLGLTIPFASNFASSINAAGTAASASAQDEAFVIYGDAVNDRVVIDGLARSAASHDIWYQYTYRVI